MKHAFRSKQRGFALPTILIASVVMFLVLISAVSATTSIRSAIDSQYYNRLAREAAESGLAFANACLKNNGYVAQWNNSSRLRPNTTCSGGAACTNLPSCFVLSNTSLRTTYEVQAPTDESVSQSMVITGRVELLRTSTGQVWRTFTHQMAGKVGVDLSVSTVAFGYDGDQGAFFSTVLPTGEAQSVGLNNQGQLGIGSTSNTLTPQKVNTSNMPAGAKIVNIFTSFLSLGYNMFFLTNTGEVYGSGQNNYGQLGNGNTLNPRSTPVKFNLPVGKVAKHVATAGYATYVLTTDNNIYAAGWCTEGLLGTGAGCSNTSTPTRVALPTPSGSNLNTIPTTNIVTDYHSTFVRMEGGAVYGWGSNDVGELANGTYTDSSTPVRIRHNGTNNYGDSSQPKATDIAFDGGALYVIDDTGTAKSVGVNDLGGLGGERINIIHNATNKCIDNFNNEAETVALWPCNGLDNQEWTFLRDTGQIYYPKQNKCLDNFANDGVTVKIWPCISYPNSGYANQIWTLRSSGVIQYRNGSRCLDHSAGDPAYNYGKLQLYSCNASSAQVFNLKPMPTMRRINLPSTAGTPIQIESDESSFAVRTSTGQVWGAGYNDEGNLGAGTGNVPANSGLLSIKRDRVPFPVRFILPSGVTATDVYTCSKDPKNTNYVNTFVIGSNGRVYGAGNNVYGQIGNGTSGSTDVSTPVAMNVIDGVNIRAEKVMCGFGTTVIFTDDKKVYTVGRNNNGQLGDGTTTNSSTPRANKYTNVLPVTIF